MGIDLGTTMTCAGVWKDGRVEILQNPEEGRKTTPSIIAFHPHNEEIIVGRNAQKLAIRYPQNVIYDVKRLIGRTIDNE